MSRSFLSFDPLGLKNGDTGARLLQILKSQGRGCLDSLQSVLREVLLANFAGNLMRLHKTTSWRPSLLALGLDQVADPVLAGRGGQELLVHRVVDVLDSLSTTFE